MTWEDVSCNLRKFVRFAIQVEGYAGSGHEAPEVLRENLQRHSAKLKMALDAYVDARIEERLKEKAP